jgi:hypothetical protein
VRELGAGWAMADHELCEGRVTAQEGTGPGPSKKAKNAGARLVSACGSLSIALFLSSF